MAKREISVGLNLRKVNSKDFDYKKMSDLIEGAYLKRNRGVSHKRKRSFAPSSIGYGSGTCPRRWYLAFSGSEYDETADALGVANMAHGVAVHDRLQELFEEAEMVIENERELVVEYPPIRAFIDSIVEVDGIQAVVEIKSTREESFVHRRFSGNPMPYHLYQLLIYMYFEGIDQGCLLYENKNDNTFLPIPVRMNDHTRRITEDCIRWMELVWDNWRQDATFGEPESDDTKLPDSKKDDGFVEASYENLPTRPFTKKSKECKSCPVFNECWNKLEEGTVDIPPMEVVKL